MEIMEHMETTELKEDNILTLPNQRLLIIPMAVTVIMVIWVMVPLTLIPTVTTEIWVMAVATTIIPMEITETWVMVMVIITLTQPNHNTLIIPPMATMAIWVMVATNTITHTAITEITEIWVLVETTLIHTLTVSHNIPTIPLMVTTETTEIKTGTP